MIQAASDLGPPLLRIAFAAVLSLGAIPLQHAAARQAAHASSPRSRSRARQITWQPSQADPTPLGDRIVAFARQQEGRTVGDGECADLAEAALRQAGARDFSAYPDSGDDYVWGRPIPLSEARPGDILQFHNFTIRTTTTTASFFGQAAVDEGWQLDSRDHHTAILEENRGGILEILEQNAPPAGRAVQLTEIPVASMVRTVQSQDGPQTQHFEVSGEIHAYRPLLAD